jgi:MFS family permease
VAFIAVERRAAEPVLPLDLFRTLNFSLVTVIGFVVGFILFGALTFLPLFQQTAQGMSAADSGLQLLPVLLPMVLVNLLGGKIVTMDGNYRVFLLTGAALMTVGLVLLAQMDSSTGRLVAAVYMAVLGIAMGLLMQLTVVVSMASAGRENFGVASSATTLFRTVGGSFGVSVLGALFASRLFEIMAARLAGSGITPRANGSHEMSPPVKAAYEAAVTGGMQRVFSGCSSWPPGSASWRWSRPGSCALRVGPLPEDAGPHLHARRLVGAAGTGSDQPGRAASSGEAGRGVQVPRLTVAPVQKNLGVSLR